MECAIDKLFNNDQHATYGIDFSLYIRENLLLPGNDLGNASSSMLYHGWVGNRFHIYFLDAGIIFYYQVYYQRLFQHHEAPTNQFPEAINEWLTSDNLIDH